MTAESSNDAVSTLLEQLVEAERAYRAGAPVMSDDEFDELRDQLEALDSDRDDVEAFLTSVPGGQELGDVPHTVKMLSLGKATTDDELTKFVTRCTNEINGPVSLTVTPKLDGVALAVRYVKGMLDDVITRGNGELGTSVSHNRDLIAQLPEELPQPLDIEVRGEVVMTHDDLAIASKNRGTPFANRRNPIGPTLNQATKDRTYDSPMRFVAFSIAISDTDSLTDDFALLDTLGFTVVSKAEQLGKMTENFEVNDEDAAATSAELRAHIDTVGLAMADASFDYLLDGAVVAVDERAGRERMGEGSRTPNWAVAFKFPSETAKGVLDRIETAVGKTGAISYTAVLKEPVQLAGTAVERASLHNPAIIAALDVRIGDAVIVTKRNEIIPQIVEVILAERPADAKPYDPSTTCPSCDEDLDFSAARPKCLSPTCSLQSRLATAAGRNGFDWDGVGKIALGKAVDAGLVNDLADVFALDAESWASLEGITDSSTKIVDIISASLKTTRLDHVLGSLGVRFVNRTFARRLAEHFGDLASIRSASIDTLLQVEGIGDGRAEAIHSDLALFGPVLDRLLELGLEPLPMPVIEVAEDAPFAGHKVLVTGTLPDGMKRDAAKEAVRTLGGQPASSVSAKTTRYVIGESAGQAKVDKIDALVASDPDRYQVLTAEEFITLLNTHS